MTAAAAQQLDDDISGGADEALMRRGRKRPATDLHPSPRRSPSVDDQDDELPDFGVVGRHGGKDATPSPLQQTEIKIQRPLGLLAQHGITTKPPTTRYKVDRVSELDDSKPLNLGQHRHHAAAAAGLDFAPALSLMDRRFMPSPPPTTAPATGPIGCLDPAAAAKPTSASSPGAHHWTFEEQFKQVSSSNWVV